MHQQRWCLALSRQGAAAGAASDSPSAGATALPHCFPHFSVLPRMGNTARYLGMRSLKARALTCQMRLLPGQQSAGIWWGFTFAGSLSLGGKVLCVGVCWGSANALCRRNSRESRRCPAERWALAHPQTGALLTLWRSVQSAAPEGGGSPAGEQALESLLLPRCRGWGGEGAGGCLLGVGSWPCSWLHML